MGRAPSWWLNICALALTVVHRKRSRSRRSEEEKVEEEEVKKEEVEEQKV